MVKRAVAPVNLAIGLDGHVWITDAGSMSKASSVIELDSSGNELGNFTGSGATGNAVNVAIDGAGRVWATSTSGGCTGSAGGNISELDSDGSALAVCSAFADPTIKTREDGARSVIEIIGAVTPVKAAAGRALYPLASRALA